MGEDETLARRFMRSASACPDCNDSRRCFAKRQRVRGEGKFCTILMESYPDGKCPFCKPERGN